MKPKLIALGLSLALAVFSLIGCGSTVSSSGGAQTASGSMATNQTFPGVWEAIELSQGERFITTEQLDSLRNLGMNIYLELKNDGGLSLRLFEDTEQSGTWETISATEASATLGENEEVSLVLRGENLLFNQEDGSMKFAKTEFSTMPAVEAVDNQGLSDEEREALDVINESPKN